MRFFFRIGLCFALATSPWVIGCSPQRSEEETPIEATDSEGDTTESPVNDADNP